MAGRRPGTLILFMFFLGISLVMTARAHGLCDPKFVNLLTDIAWNAVFPIRIGSMLSLGSGDPEPDPPAAASRAVCSCPGPRGIPIPGISVSFWEPVYIFESVHDAFCFPSMGIEMSGVVDAARLDGTIRASNGKAHHPTFFAQAHFIKFPAWAILNLFTDIDCLDKGDIDIGYMTELDPMWQNDLQSMVLHPEALVFGNPVLQLACSSEALSTIADLSVNVLYWCMGQWGGVYPFAGMMQTQNPAIGHIGTASKLLYKMHREQLICDTNINPCGCVRTPIWRKSHFKLQIIRPKVMYETIRIGEPSPLWETGLTNPLQKGVDNAAYIVWKKVSCCLMYNPVVP